MKDKRLFILNLTNNTSGNIPVTLLNQGNPGTNIANATTKYQWDITGISYATPNVTLALYPVGSTGAYSILTGVLQSQNATGLVSLLNTFNIGIFWVETSGPNTYIVTWNSNVVYGDLSVGVVTTTIAWSNTNPFASLNVLANAIAIITSPSGPGSGTVTVNNGDAITGGGAAAITKPFTLLITRTFKFPPFNTQVLQNSSGVGVVYLIIPFTIDASYTYSITLTP